MATTTDEDKRYPLYASLDATRSDLDRMGAQARAQAAVPAAAPPTQSGGAVFGFYPQLAGSKRTNYATDQALRTGVQAAPGGFQPAAPTEQPSGLRRDLPAGVQASAAGAGRGTVNPPAGINTTTAATATMGAQPAPLVGGFSPARDSQGANDVPTVRTPSGYTGPEGAGVSEAPGVRKVVDAQGRTLYTNRSIESDAELMGRGAVSAQNNAAADALAARYASQPGQLESQPAAGQGEVAPRASVIGQTGGFGLLDRERMAAREREMAAEKAMRGVGSRTRASVYAQLERGDRADAANLTANASNNATVRRGQDLQDAQAQERLGLDQQRVGFEGTRAAADVAQSRATTADVQTRTQAAMQLMSAQNELLKARASGDAKASAAAEENLRALQGKYEREIPDLFGVTPIPGGIDPATGQPRGSGAVVLNKRTGEAKFVSPGEVQGAPGTKPGATTKEEYEKLPKGARYVAPDGKTYIKG